MAIKTYNGREKFIFISYSHKNSERVLKVVELLDKRSYRQWYDGGIYSGGMCDSVNNGTFIVEEGGSVKIERAHNFYSYGEYINSGD